MSYLDLLKLASPEAIVVLTALVVLSIGLLTERASAVCALVGALGLAIATGAVLMLPRNASLFGGMLVITPLTSLFKVICLGLAFLRCVWCDQKNPCVIRANIWRLFFWQRSVLCCSLAAKSYS